MASGTLWPWSWTVAAMVILATVCVALQNQARRWPKGMASLPVIGDTVGFFRGPRDFLLDCFTRYGDPFNDSVMGQKITVINSPEVIKFLLQFLDDDAEGPSNDGDNHWEPELEARHKIILSHRGSKNFTEQLSIDFEKWQYYPFFNKRPDSL